LPFFKNADDSELEDEIQLGNVNENENVVIEVFTNEDKFD